MNSKIFERITKLLALARDGGATEAEAELAMAKAQELMFEHNLTLATLDAKSTDGRVKEADGRSLMYPWKRSMIEAIAEVNFCHLAIQWKYTKSGEQIAKGFELIGREDNVVATRNMIDYLFGTIEHLVITEVGTSPQARYTRWAHSFRLGASQRLRERLHDRYEAALRDQERAAREAMATARHPAAPTANAVVVVMRDYAQTEADLNRDFLYGYVAGTTARQRAEREAKYAAERANAVPVVAREQTEAEKQAAELRSKRFWDAWQRKQDRAEAKIDRDAFRTGQIRAEEVTFDPQLKGE